MNHLKHVLRIAFGFDMIIRQLVSLIFVFDAKQVIDTSNHLPQSICICIRVCICIVFVFVFVFVFVLVFDGDQV